MITFHSLCNGDLLVGIISGTIRDAVLLDSYERALSDPALRRRRAELYLFTPAAKLLISFSAYTQIADITQSTLEDASNGMRTAVVSDSAEVLANAKVYAIALAERGGGTEEVRAFSSLPAALEWLESAEALEEITHLLPTPPVCSGLQAPRQDSTKAHYADIHDIVSHAPLVLMEYVTASPSEVEFLYLSEAAESVLGFPPRFFTSDEASWAKQKPQEVRDFSQSLRRIINGNDQVTIREIPYNHPQQGQIWLQISSAQTPRKLKGVPVWSGYALDVTKRKALELSLQEEATHDPLTAVLNRREVCARLEHELARSTRYRRPLSIVMLDIDHFKKVNDQHGHLAGDEVLRQVCRVLGNLRRKNDHLGRYGGEEFLLVLPETEGADAMALAERIRTALEGTPIQAAGKVVHVTASFGIASLDKTSRQTANALLASADSALYKAKNSGRNRVCT
ncbi:MAG: GGDEF domain-containing protein [Wenzhouxiangella sp.]|nr:GGDEF domain-containing protein [Wenzhouxiangella sp.]